ncbi:MAG: UvrB/UvrC motif-containing protein [Puniceicoccales bacterium]|nr:UvrB/UvrC motif-containing protein [Puniceicoccales bacterium]
MKKCQFCGKPATVHLTQVINSEMQNVDLCDECAAKHGLFEQSGSPLSVLAALGEAMFGTTNQNLAVNGLICSNCGCTPTIFKESGRLGCENCYKDLRPLIEKIIENSQKGVKHLGKQLANCTSEGNGNAEREAPAPQKHICKNHKCACKHDHKHDLGSLKSELERAIAEERYEDAAVLRDKIKKYSN